MPAMLDDPNSPTIFRTSGAQPFPQPYGALPENIIPRQVTLRDRTTTATLVPFSSPQQVPPHLTAYLCKLLNREIEKGDTYPMIEPMALSQFGVYWFANFGAIMVVGDIQTAEEITQMEERGADWEKECLGSFYVKPNYPGRSSHICNGGFLVTDASRNRGVGRLMGEQYLDWAPKLGYTYSVFNLVYETNVASLRIWDALGFKRIGRIKGCGQLKSYPDQLIDAIMFGRELGGDGDEFVTEERFDKIRFYLQTGTYPPGSDRAEKSRLRSAATHYKLVQSQSGDAADDVLTLKGKEVVSDPHRQYEIARNMHAQSHGGINKTTAGIAEKYHWVRIKETVSAAIRNCSECKDANPKMAQSFSSNRRGPAVASKAKSTPSKNRQIVTAGADSAVLDAVAGASQQQHSLSPQPQQQTAPPAPMAHMQYSEGVPTGYEMRIDPQIMHGIDQWEQQQAMQVDGATHNDDGSTSGHDTVDERLREELEAQIQGSHEGINTMSDSNDMYPDHEVQQPGTTE